MSNPSATLNDKVRSAWSPLTRLLDAPQPGTLDRVLKR